MHSGSKLFGRNLAETLSNVEMKAKEQHDSDRKIHESLDNLIRQTIGKEPLFSFTKAGDSPLQWIHWLDSWDKVATGSKVELRADGKNNKQAEGYGSEKIPANNHGFKDSVHGMKNSEMFGRGLQGSGERLHSLKIPEAVVAFAQAAAKANDLPGWPLVSPKISLQKCDKCLHEFCSPLNYRRHIRMHRRPLNVDKEDLRKLRSQVAEFLDKLSVDEVCQIVSFKSMILEDLSGASVVKALPGFLQQPGSSLFHQSYLKAGSTLLEIVQSKVSKFPLSSEDLFNVLDDSSEKTFLCGALSVSMQRFMFEGEAGKVGLEARNLVASLGFLVEQRLVKAWMAERDEEALRRQKALVEEEEAAQKKRAKLQERKRLKKIRQKELKEKERRCTESEVKTLEFDSFERGSQPSHTGVDDSPSSTQSISSDYSRQDHHLESCMMDIDDDFTVPGDNRGDTLFTSADEVNSQGVDEHEAPGLSDVGFATENVIEFGNSSNGQADIIQVCSQEIQHPTEEHFDQNNENVKLFMPFKTSMAVRFVSEENVNHAWRERRRGFNNEVPNYQRPFYASERRFSDGMYRQAHRFTRKPYSMPWAEAHDFSPVSLVNKPFMVSRYRHYNDRPLGVRRNTTNVRSTHVVWTKKVQRDPELQPSTLIDASKIKDSIINASIMLVDEKHIKDERVLTEDGHAFGIGGLGNIAPSNSNGINSLAASCEDSYQALSHGNSDVCLSCDSSILSDSVSCQSSASTPTKGPEEGNQNKDVGPSGHESDVDETSCLSWQSVEDKPEVSSSGGALFIGSLSIPLQVSPCGKSEGGSNEKLKRLSRDIQHSPGKKQRGEATSSLGSPFSDAPKEKTKPKKPMILSFEISEEGNVSGSRQSDDREVAVGPLEIKTGNERTGNQYALLNEANEECSTAKMWQPVGTIGEWSEVSINESRLSHTRKEGLPFLDITAQEDCNSAYTSGPVQAGGVEVSGNNLSLESSIVETRQEYDDDEVKSNEGRPPGNVASPARVALKPEVSMLSESNKNAVDLPMALNFTRETHLTCKWKCEKRESLTRFVATFLSRRWADAVASFEG